MYRPFTVDLFQIQEYLRQHFDLGHFIQIPLTQGTVIIQDSCGQQLAFTCQDSSVKQIPIPSILSKKDSVAYIRLLRQKGKAPDLRTFHGVTKWWATTPNPLTYQQALGLPDDLYVHYLTHDLLNDEEVLHIVSQKIITEDEYRDLYLWCRNGNFCRSYLGAYGVDGFGASHKFIWNYGTPEAKTFIFYIKNEYCCFMHGIPYEQRGTISCAPAAR